MSREENKQFDKNDQQQQSPKANSNDPGNFSQRGEHVNRNPNEPVGGLKNDREDQKDENAAKKGDRDQSGTQNNSSVSRGDMKSMTERSQDQRSGKFGPEHNSNTTGF